MLNIVFPAQNGKVYFSYKKIKDNLSSLIEDSRTFAYKHTIKADAIKERVFQNEEDNVYGIMYEIEGNTASAVQFFVTDSVRHFIRGSLYFDAHPNKDSLAPLVSFIKEDVLVLMESIKWNNK